MKCQKCGAEIPDNKIYCEKCGSPIQMVPDYNPVDDIRIGEEKKVPIPEKVTETVAEALPSGKRKYILAAVFAAFLGVLIYRTAYRIILEPVQETETEAVVLLEKPTFSLPSGTYSYMPTLTISHSQREEGVIYYTTDGSTPNEDSQIFNGPIKIGEGKTVVRAVFIRSDGMQSEEADGTYQVEFDYPEEPVFSVGSGEYQGSFSVIITAEPDCTIYYTMDGSDPDQNSSVYRSPVVIPSGLTVLRAVSVDEEGGMSGIIEAIYNVQEIAPAEDPVQNTMPAEAVPNS